MEKGRTGSRAAESGQPRLRNGDVGFVVERGRTLEDFAGSWGGGEKGLAGKAKAGVLNSLGVLRSRS